MDVMRIEANIVSLFNGDNAAIVVVPMTSRYGKRVTSASWWPAIPS